MTSEPSLLQFYLRTKADTVSVVALAASYLRFARRYYRKNGKPTNEVYTIKRAVSVAVELYGRLPAEKFGPKALRAVQGRMIEKGWCRNQINKQVDRVKRCFRWAVSEELVSGSVYEGLRTLPGLRIGRSAARETTPIMPVDNATVDATLHCLSRTVADMVRLQRLTGMRPGEVCALRPIDVTQSKGAWVYRPSGHKAEHHGKDRVIFIGPRAQKILRRYMKRLADSYCFSPRESLERWRQEQHKRRQTPLSCGNRPGKNLKANPKRKPRDHYDVWSYGHAIARAARKAGVEHWSPHQLRHSFATEVRKNYGLEAAQVTLGHAKADITQVYAERDFGLALKVAKKIG